MKRKFAFCLLVSSVLATCAAGGIKVLGQSGRDPNRLPNNGPVSPNIGQCQTSDPLYIAPNYTQPGMPPQSTGPQSFPPPQVLYPSYPGGPGVPNQGMLGYGPTSFTVVKKDGSVERIQKEAGIKLTKEEFDQVNETRQKVQSAVSQLRSPDADESKRKESKELIAKFLKVEFQADQESRREQVKLLEKQVEQLKKQLSKRDELQDKLIELRLQLLENDASGLSFPESWGNLPGLPMNNNGPSNSTSNNMPPLIQNQQYPDLHYFVPARKATIPAVPVDAPAK